MTKLFWVVFFYEKHPRGSLNCALCWLSKENYYFKHNHDSMNFWCALSTPDVGLAFSIDKWLCEWNHSPHLRAKVIVIFHCIHEICQPWSTAFFTRYLRLKWPSGLHCDYVTLIYVSNVVIITLRNSCLFTPGKRTFQSCTENTALTFSETQ